MSTLRRVLCSWLICFLASIGLPQVKYVSNHWEGSWPFVYRGLHCDDQGLGYSVCNTYGGQYNRIKFSKNGQLRLWQHHNIAGYVQDSEIDNTNHRLYIVGDNWDANGVPYGFISCIDTNTGIELWNLADSTGRYGAVTIGSDGSAYVYATANMIAKLMKFDLAGGLSWQSTFQSFGELLGGYPLRIADISVTSSGDVFVGAGGYDWDPQEGVIVRCSATTGQILWHQRVGLWSICKLLPSGSRLYAVGSSASSGWTASVMAFDNATGNMIWQRDSTAPGSNWTEASYDACVDGLGNLYWTGGAYLWNQAQFRYDDWRSVTESISSSGILNWRKENQNPLGSFSNACLPDGGGGVIVASGEGRTDGWLDRVLNSYRANGSVRWSWRGLCPGATRQYEFSTTLCQSSNPGGFLLGLAQVNNGGGTHTARLQLVQTIGPHR
ncbi:MAG: PQQ-like beta-propeller repeat protein [Chthonomonadaceae bacterium]|nr:PQQ-like beta-propeller repeat protein [Chthonomonadaceae bacterium]